MKPLPWEDESIAANGRRVKDNFADWFDQSKVVDKTGVPMVLYHGTASDFDEFDLARAGKNYARRGGERSLCFTNRPIPAGVYAEQASGAFFGDEENPRFGDGTACIMPVYMSLKKPYVRKAAGSPDKWFDSNHLALFASAKKNEADGIIIHGGKGFEIRSVYIAFSPLQIKSATGNAGLFLKESASLDDQHSARLMRLARDARHAAHVDFSGSFRAENKR